APVAPPVVAAGRATVGPVDLGPRAAEAPPTHPGTRDALVELVDGTAAAEEPEQPTTVVGTAAVPRSSLAIAPRAASGSVPPAPGTYQPPGARPHPMEALPAGGLPPEPP